jgi:glycosyltransferase involved in cell wall biosynthesis
MKASVIVPTFNRRTALKRTLEGLFGQTQDPDEFEIIVVDDHSADDTPMVVENLRAGRRNVGYIRHDANRGRAVTRNDGIVAARGEIVIFLDDDNVPCQRFIAAHLECHRRAAPERVAVIGNVSFAAESIQRSNFGRYLNEQYLGNRAPSRRRGLDYSNLPARCFGTLNASVHRDDAIRVGMFDTAFRYYGGEDFYFGHCLRLAGMRICFCEEARTTHCDEVSIERYKMKYQETTREGVRTIRDKDPSAIDETGLRPLMPVEWASDSISSIVTKWTIRGVLNGAVLSALEYWARATDRYSILSCKACFRALLAGWYLQGLRSKDVGRGEVTYGGA